ncbi:MAG: DNA translocase FtsK 4TM domain-containing protein [Akkermansiaceae bacterium]|nr:DNA translocase FtsK 4TM domain-containing protein [Akkermansiaceae bacterium]
MARSGNKRKGEPEAPSRWSNELTGVLWIAGGLLLLLSLVRYSPADLPRWGFLEAFAGKSGAQGQNLIGPVGGVLGFIQILLFGAAAFLVPISFIWFGVIKLAFDGRIWPRCVIGFALMLLAGAAFLEAADFFFKGWANRCNINSPGGVIGNGLGGHVMVKLLGKVGTIIVALAAYPVAMILLTGQRPIVFTKACLAWIWKRITTWWKNRGESGKIERRERELLKEREKEREKRKREREQARKEEEKKKAEEEAKDGGQGMLPLKETPAPQIIDSSQRRQEADTAPGAKPFERKKPTHQFLSVSDFEDYDLPGFDLLDEMDDSDAPEANKDQLIETQTLIVDTLKAFGIDVTPGDITRGPTITRYEIYPSTGLRVSRISQLEPDLARATRAERINILAPIPGKDTVGIEIANADKVAVPLRELVHDAEFRSAKKKIPLALGKDVYGRAVIGDLAAMPHCLVAGATGSGKSVCINSIIASMLFKFGPDELRFIMVDPKVVEMQMYNRLPHLVVPVVTDPKKTVSALKWVVNEMEKRYRIFAKEGVRNFDGFNNRPRKDAPGKATAEKTAEPDQEAPEVTAENAAEPGEAEEGGVPKSHQAPPWSDEDVDTDKETTESIATALEEGDLTPEAEQDDLGLDLDEEEETPDRFPYIVVLIDELADLMQTAPADVEMCIARIAQKARAAGIHLIIATQTPRADVVTGIIKANIPSRIAFQVSSQLDSRVILDTKGAEKLVGKGDMLYLPPGSAKLERAQGAFVTDEEVERIIDHCAAQGEPNFEEEIEKAIMEGDVDEEDEVSDADEEMITKCIEVVKQEQKASTSLLQRRLRLGYTRAARMIDILEQRGIVGPADGARPREVYMK